MRTPIIAGNWKMNKTLPESVAFVKELAPALAPYTSVERVVGPTYVALAAVSEALSGTDIAVSSQGIHWEDEGAYTSQIAPVMIQDLVTYAIIGHSECRAYLGETDEEVNKKARAALAHGIKPIIAVGESLEQNEAGETSSFVGGQVRAALEGISAEDMPKVVIAYEPIWAIGTGKSASGEIAQNIIGGTIRAVLIDLYGDEVAQKIRIQYGGSVKPDNMAEYMSQPDVDGALVGGASLKVDAFTELVKIAAEVKGA
ncbi:triose-phosphate isomerase [Phototrophicus methaneseepsis]|uniref:Triosephosphate isomerase n=1 Tax=Phototrophicus methaneseepsis TaxID=2710758 RepID=A0A7S8E699_9CHLR|nr:triose-phosphate isomerase [Phototrophicus methaneseepsis]QPC81156.1 triose-phosphate isomerase [Phototrophicus methaneseepsis]